MIHAAQAYKQAMRAVASHPHNLMRRALIITAMVLVLIGLLVGLYFLFFVPSHTSQ